jgi:hypothetical protein
MDNQQVSPDAGLAGSPTLRAYMETHAGEYVFPDSIVPVRADQLDPTWADQQVDVYLVAQLPDGRVKFHVYTLYPRRHILTHIDIAQTESSGNPEKET